jgi:hypothetical protein
MMNTTLLQCSQRNKVCFIKRLFLNIRSKLIVSRHEIKKYDERTNEQIQKKDCISTFNETGKYNRRMLSLIRHIDTYPRIDVMRELIILILIICSAERTLAPRVRLRTKDMSKR